MSFSNEWDNIYKANAQLTRWPFSDLISYVMRYARPSGSDCRVLELGCGAGANIPFFKSLGVQYYGIEGSKSAVSMLYKQFPEMKNVLLAGDFTKSIPFSGSFDLVVDRSSVTHNSGAAIKDTLKLVHDKLKPGGKFIGIDWFSTEHSEYMRGRAGEDTYTRLGFEDGQFKGVGKVHFSDKEHLKELLSGFVIERLEHKTVNKEVPDDGHVVALWNFVARKA